MRCIEGTRVAIRRGIRPRRYVRTTIGNDCRCTQINRDVEQLTERRNYEPIKAFNNGTRPAPTWPSKEDWSNRLSARLQRKAVLASRANLIVIPGVNA